MEKNSVLSNAAATDPTVRKLYRACVDCVKVLDQGMKEKADLRSVVSLTSVRKRLRECCEKLILINPLEFGRKADDILWRKCYYEPIRVLRQNAEALNSEGKCFLNSLLMSAIGYYQLLSLKLQQEYPSSEVARNGLQSFSPIWKNEKQQTRVDKEAKETIEWSISARQRLLIYQGDLARYLHEVDDNVGVCMAQHYYQQALLLKPTSGTPYNQLGTLFLTVNYGLDATYYYLRCICSEESFTGAADNLATLLSKIEAQLESDQYVEGEWSKTGNSEDDLKRFILVLLKAVRILHLDESKSNNDGSVQTICGKTLHAFSIVMKHFVTVDSPQNDADSTNLTFDMVVKIFAILILLIWKLQGKGSMKLSPAVALFLSMFASFLSSVIKDFSDDLSKHRRGFKTGDETRNEKSSNGEAGGRNEKERIRSSKAPTTKKPLLTKRRRGSSEEGESDFSGEESIESEQEINGRSEISLSMVSGSSSDDVVEISDDESFGIAKLISNGHQQRKTENTVDASMEVSLVPLVQEAENLKPLIDLDPSEKVEILSTYAPLVPLKIVCDWFRCNPDLLLLVQQNSRDLWSQMARLFNFLPDDRQLSALVEGDSHLSAQWKEAPILFLNDWIQKYPLPEDVMLRGVKPLSQIHRSLDYTCDWRRSFTCEAIVRICCLREFGHYLIRLNTPCFQFDRARLEFISNNGQTIYQQEPKDIDRKATLMRSMAQLRLKGELEAAEQLAWIPVYLVPDSQALCNKLPLMKKLAAAQKFVIVIATKTVDELDKMKKESSTARSATRWLEMQFRRGNKFVRMQKSAENEDALNITEANGRGSTGEHAPNFVEILKCASQLRRLVKAGTTCSSTIVTVVTGYSKSCKEFEQADELLRAAKLTGVALMPITNFSGLWDAHRKKGS